MIQRHDAGVPRLHHPDFDATAQSHLIEAADEVHIPVDIEDLPRFTGLEQVQGNDLGHGGGIAIGGF
jgi:hypothetical protein